MSPPRIGRTTPRRLRRTLSRSRWGEYRRFLGMAISQGYAVLSLEDWLEDPQLAGGRPALILRHDVDQYPRSALVMAAIEADFDVRSTWYFRWRTARPEVVDAVRGAGHAVGLHYETLTRMVREQGLPPSRAAELVPSARALLGEELRAFAERIGPCRSACPHGDSRVPGVHNGILLRDQEWSDYGLEWDANDAMRRHSLDLWLTDRSVAEGGWANRMDPIDLLIDRRTPILAVVHPNNWASGAALWTDRVLPGRTRTGSDAPPEALGQGRRQTPQT